MADENSLRRRAKCRLAGLFHSVGLWNLRPGEKNSFRVVGLHRVLTKEQASNANSLPAMLMSQENFEALLAYLSRCYELLPVSALATQGALSGQRPACILTFDDGWEDTHTTAFPLLRKYQVPAAVFLSTGFIGTRRVFWVEQLLRAGKSPERTREILAAMNGSPARTERYESLEGIIEHLKRMPSANRDELLARLLPQPNGGHSGDGMMNWNQVKEMSQSGIEFGAHTVNHPLLTYESKDVVMRELSDSKRCIEEVTGRPAESFAYPNGDWNPDVRRCVVEAGFQSALTVKRGWHSWKDDRYTIRRVFLHDGNVTGLSGKFSPAVLEWTMNGWL